MRHVQRIRQAAGEVTELVCPAIVNTTFFPFADNSSLNMVVSKGKTIAHNLQTDTLKTFDGRRQIIYPTQGVFGILPDGRPDIAWVYPAGGNLEAYAYEAPNAPDNGKWTKPSRKKGKRWKVVEAAGGAPVLLPYISSVQEIQFAWHEMDKHPRTATGYTAENDVIILAEEGRHPGIAEGATLPQLARILSSLGCIEALNLDGGGSTSLMVRPCGKGFVMNGADLQTALDHVKAMPDVKLPIDSVAFLHRKLDTGDIYFITNQSSKKISFDPAFKITGKVPELWNALTGTSRTLPEYTVNNNYTTVPLELDVYESAFIVFNKNGSPAGSPNSKNFPLPEKTIPLKGPWTVQFDKTKRGPEKPVVFDTLMSWTTFANDSVKYYSGTATYTKTFELNALHKEQQVSVDLGEVMVIAKVKVNGMDVGGVWTAPYQVDITKALRPGQNTIEIRVTNNWMNRLIGDSILPPEQRKTWTNNNPFKLGSVLQTSGLSGPVSLHIYSNLKFIK